MHLHGVTGPLVAALDIGGTKIAGALVDTDGRLVTRSLRPTPPGGDGETVMRAVAEVVGELRAAPQWDAAVAVGIGSAGPVDAVHGTVSPVNVPGWRDFPLAPRVAGAAGGLPVVLAGDGVAMTAAEHWQGAARGYDNALCMVVSTGVGGGLVLGGTLLPGPTGNAGHIGHISVDLDGDACPCGSRGCVERLASGPNIARRAVESGWTPPAGAAPTAAAVAESARAGDPLALASFDRAAQALAAGIAATATLVEIHVAVIGGGVAGAGPVLFDPLREHLARYATLSFAAGVDVVPAKLGTDAGLVGAAAAAAQGLASGAGARRSRGALQRCGTSCRGCRISRTWCAGVLVVAGSGRTASGAGARRSRGALQRCGTSCRGCRISRTWRPRCW